MQESSYLKSQSKEVLARKIEYIIDNRKQGTIGDVEKLFRSPNGELEKLINNLPKRAHELMCISQATDMTKRTFNYVTKKSFDYLKSIIDLEIAASGDKSDLTWYKMEIEDKDG